MAAEDCPDVPEEIVAELRGICLALPEVDEEQAWVGHRWVVRRKNFAQVFYADEGTTPLLIKIARAIGPGPLLVFRSEGPELEALRNQGPPFYPAGWGRDVMGLKLDGHVDWDEVRELVTESYCVMAPQKLRRLVDRPG
ncbi:MAG: MmcQ/YjbR family DNA-binding protein [Actinomycetota bacterium]|nr:MmcQ/YjbR family DNA-binding protein [Actinomycetota bacterium]